MDDPSARRGGHPRSGSFSSDDERALLRTIPEDFGAEGIAEHAEIERETVHDVKAIEYYIKRRLAGTSLEPLAEVVHIYCTSEDVNNLSYALMIRGAVHDVWLPAFEQLIGDLQVLARETADVPMLSRTHGQPATPTTLGKEMAVFAHRLGRQARRLARRRDARQDQRRHRHLRRARRRRAVGRLGAGLPQLRRAPGAHLEPADHADRVP